MISNLQKWHEDDVPAITRNASLVGEPAAVRERIRARHSGAFIYATFSPAGAMLYQTGSEKSPGIGLWDANGINARDLGRPGEHYSPAFSPDGQHLVVGWRESDHSANQDLWTYDLGRSAWVQTTTDSEWDGSPIWSPDGREMAYSSLSGGVPAIYVQSPLTASGPRRITHDKLSRHPTDWSPDGKFLLVTDESNVASSGYDQALLPLDGSASIRINPTPFSERHGRFLPTDATWIA